MAKGFKHGGGGDVKTGTPEFTYTGEHEFINEGNKNWKLKLLTSGTLTFTKPYSAAKGIDVFLVGGGAGGDGAATYDSGDKGGAGGSGAYSRTEKGVTVVGKEPYEIVVGAGGRGGAYTESSGGSGGNTSAFGFVANGGSGLSTDRTVREFGEKSGNTYCSAGRYRNGSAGGTANTGNGGDGATPALGGRTGGSGGSGIVIIRNARGQ